MVISADTINVIVDAIEAFIDAKIGYQKRYAADPEYASSGEVDAARENLERKLTAIVSGS